MRYDRFMVAADFDAYWEAQREVDAAVAVAGSLVARQPFSTPRAWAGFRRTAPSANTPATSGTCRSADLALKLPPPSRKRRATRARPSCVSRSSSSDRQFAPPVRMLIDGAGNIDLIEHAQHIVERNGHQTRDGVAARNAATAARSSAA